jgi:hypothetical protein
MTYFPRRTASRRLLPVVLAILCLLPAAPLRAATSAEPPSALPLPARFGRIVYRQHRENPYQVYIVADSHRSCDTGTNGPETVEAQAETYRIGEWLIERKRIDLLLPEGFFGHSRDSVLRIDPREKLGNRTLEEKLADTSHFVNAELLLHRQFGIGLAQVEDRRLYQRARALLLRGLETGTCLSPAFNRRLAYLQRRRLAAILQNIPGVMETASRRKDPSAPKAMMTIGASHLGDLIRFLQAGKIRIPAPPSRGDRFPAYHAPLALRNLGVTVIVPRTLLKNRRLLQTAGLSPQGADGP